MSLKSNLTLVEGEELLAVVEGEMWATGVNAWDNFVQQLKKTFLGCFGYKHTAQLCITNRRIVVERHEVCNCMEISNEFITLLPQSIASVDSSATGTCCCGLCIKKHFLKIVQNSGVGYGFALKGGAEQIRTTMELALKLFVR